MKKLVVIIAIATLVPVVSAQRANQKPRTVPNGLSTVQKYRAQYPTPMGSMNTLDMLRKVASELGGGIYRKPSGDNCGGFSCDIICFPNDRVYFDVLGDAEGTAIPSWSGPQPMAPDTLGNCVLQSPSIPGPVDPPPVDPPTNTSAATVQLQQQQIILMMQMLAKQEEQNEALRQGLADLKAEIAKGVKIRW